MRCCVFFVVVLGTLHFLNVPCLAHQRILVVNSYHEGFKWTDSIMTGFSEAVRSSLPDAEIHVEYLDAKRFSPIAVRDAFEKLITAKYRDAKPDVLVASDDAAFNLILDLRDKLWPEIPVVFCGVNDFNPASLAGRGPVTGVVEDFDLAAVLDLALRVLPHAKVAAVVSDITETGRINFARFLDVKPRYADRLSFIELAGLSGEELAAELAKLPKDAFVLHLSFYRDRLGKTFTVDEMIKLVDRATPAPIFVAWDFVMGRRVLGGHVVNGALQGRTAGVMTVDLLRGTPIDQIPILAQSPNIPMFDHRELLRLDIDRNTLPPDSVVINKPEDLFSKHRGMIYAAVGVMLCLLVMSAFMFLNILSRRKAWRALAATEKSQRLLIETTTEGIWRMDALHRTIYVNQAMADMLGYAVKEMLGRPVEAFFFDEDMPGHADHMRKRHLGRDEVYERRFRRKDGTELWTMASAKSLKDDQGAFAGSFAMFSDITPRVRAEGELRRSELHLRTLKNAIPDLVWLKDKNGVYLDCNPAFERFFGFSESEILGRDDYDFFEREDAEFFRRHDARALEAGRPVKNEERLCFPDDNVKRLFETIKTPFYGLQGEAIGVLGIARDITERKHAARALAASEEQFRLLFQGMTDAFALHEMLYDDDGNPIDYRFIQVNPAFEKLTGLSAEHVEGGTVRSLLPTLENRWINAYDHVLKTGEPVHFEDWSGDLERWFEVTAYRHSPGRFAVLFRDVTARRRSQDILEARLRLGRMANTASLDEIMPATLDEVERLTGSTIGFFHFVEPDGVTLSLQCWSSKTKTVCQTPGKGAHYPVSRAGIWADAVRLKKTILHNDYEAEPGRRGLPEGHAPVFRELVTPVLVGDQPAAVLGVGNKPRPYTQADVELTHQLAHLAWEVVIRKRTQDELVRSKAKAEAANRAKSEFLANMSHEIRTPLNGVLGMLQVLEAGDLSQEQRDLLHTAVSSSRRLTRLLSDILDLSKIEAGKLSIHEEPFAPAELMAAVSDLLSTAAKEKGLSLRFTVDSRLPVGLIGDEVRLRQILFNLVGNAIKFTECGEISVELQLLREAPEQVRVLFTVQDAGVGIPDDRLGDVFKPFVQGEGLHTRRFQGAGLGLSIVSKLVGLMKGEMCIESEPGHGATVFVSFPLAACRNGSEVSTCREAPSTATDISPKHILVVDDDRIGLMTAQKMLAKLGHHVSTARDGLEALRLIAENSYDLVLMDVQMPVMDGVEAVRSLRAAEARTGRPRLPTAALTAYAMSGDREKLLAAGMDDYIAKPLDMQELARVILRLGSGAPYANGG